MLLETCQEKSLLAPGYTDIPEGHIASVTTYLHMREKPSAEPVEILAGLSVRYFPRPELAWYRELFRAVGGDWLWFSRLRMDDGQLAAILHDERVDIFALIEGNQAKGLLELARRQFPDIELAFFGLTEDLFGRGAGRAAGSSPASNPSDAQVAALDVACSLIRLNSFGGAGEFGCATLVTEQTLGT